MATKKLSTPSVLAFESKLACSDAIFSAGDWDARDTASAWQPILVTEKAVRGTISNRLKKAIASDSAKLDAEIQKANLQTVDTAALPFDADTLHVHFSLRVLGGLEVPSTCNSPEYQQALSSLIEGYVAEHGFSELASRYAQNIANGRFLWRNRVGAEEVEVRVSLGDEKWVFDSLCYSLRSFGKEEAVKELALAIEKGLKGEETVLLHVHAFTKLGAAQTVFPSQELVLEKGDKSKHLYQLNGVAAMHSQKIGNALRTIDTWYPEAEEVGPIAVEPFGSVTNRGKAYRQPKPKQDFYTLLDNWLLKDKAPSVEQQHYIMAMFIRGGVFGE
ncbi:type I-F CRISPR-associated protein Csy3 [Halodesulfovibrio sp.]|jgi:CRISPR-associated protein Csy3|uniref:type I-F CRISPR-associated protein Csy3 n=1 Tax=Halodesulfovibrio sp. TaxID=1912772 RepID=UPI0025F8E3D9|nr:type I-F CRISPR-associated protein Csy3 [Halodesulfovibrio sp.]MCT4627551.1 type I-F CRISPR-associated protein Csy3 [Halodesulfovibrio sp.]